MARVDEAFGRELRQTRRAKGYTQDSLAAKLHVAEKTVGKWERHEVMPTATNIRALERLGLIDGWVGRNGRRGAQNRQSEGRQTDASDAPAAEPSSADARFGVGEHRGDCERELLAIFRQFDAHERRIILEFFRLLTAGAANHEQD